MPEDIDMEHADRVFKNIARLCNKSGIKITELPKKAGFANSLLTQWYLGNGVEERKLRSVTDYFEVPYHELFCPLSEKDIWVHAILDFVDGMFRFACENKDAAERNRWLSRAMSDLEKMRDDFKEARIPDIEKYNRYEKLLAKVKSTLESN